MRLSVRQFAKAVGMHATPRKGVTTRLAEEVDKFSNYNPTTLTLENFVTFAENKSPATSFRFLSKELPVRFGNIMKEFRFLPEHLHYTPSVQAVEESYEESFNEMLQYQDMSSDSVTFNKFNDTLSALLRRHSTAVETMAQGVLEMKERHPDDIISERHMQRCIQYFLDRFYLNRIGVRMLINQHLLMFTDITDEGCYIGAIDTNCDVQAIAEDAYDNAKFLCEQYYLTSPQCNIECQSPYEKDLSNRITMTYVPTHLYHMLFELLKNALRAVVEAHEGQLTLPAINILICKGQSDITIKISDQGGGIRRSEIGSLFSYTYSTAPTPLGDECTPMAGYGFGLPLSYLYARYFNGDLWLNSVDGFGTDAMLCLKYHPSSASELLPIYNKTAEQKYIDQHIISDWTDVPQGSGVDGKRSIVGYQKLG